MSELSIQHDSIEDALEAIDCLNKSGKEKTARRQKEASFGRKRLLYAAIRVSEAALFACTTCLVWVRLIFTLRSRLTLPVGIAYCSGLINASAHGRVVVI